MLDKLGKLNFSTWNVDVWSNLVVIVFLFFCKAKNCLLTHILLIILTHFRFSVFGLLSNLIVSSILAWNMCFLVNPAHRLFTITTKHPVVKLWRMRLFQFQVTRWAIKLQLLASIQLTLKNVMSSLMFIVFGLRRAAYTHVLIKHLLVQVLTGTG